MPKSKAYWRTLKVSCLKWETAWRFSTWVVRMVVQSMHSANSGFIMWMLLKRRSVPFTRSSTDGCVFWDTVPWGPFVLDDSFKFLFSLTLATVDLMYLSTSTTFCSNWYGRIFAQRFLCTLSRSWLSYNRPRCFKNFFVPDSPVTSATYPTAASVANSFSPTLQTPCAAQSYSFLQFHLALLLVHIPLQQLRPCQRDQKIWFDEHRSLRTPNCF